MLGLLLGALAGMVLAGAACGVSACGGSFDRSFAAFLRRVD